MITPHFHGSNHTSHLGICAGVLNCVLDIQLHRVVVVCSEWTTERKAVSWWASMGVLYKAVAGLHFSSQVLKLFCYCFWIPKLEKILKCLVDTYWLISELEWWLLFFFFALILLCRWAQGGNCLGLASVRKLEQDAQQAAGAGSWVTAFVSFCAVLWFLLSSLKLTAAVKWVTFYNLFCSVFVLYLKEGLSTPHL